MDDLTIALIFYGAPLLLYFYKKVYDYYRYEKKLKIAIVQSKRISIEKIEKAISFYSKKAKFLDQKLYRESGIIKKNYEKDDIDFIYWEKEYQKSLGKFSDKDWEPIEWRIKWDCFYYKKRKDLEINLKKLFSPD